MSDRRRWSWNFLKSKDRNVILICIGIAFVLWLTTKLSKDYTHEYRFNLVFDLPENLAFRSSPPDEVRASLSGEGWQLFVASFKRRFNDLHIDVPPTTSDITRTDLIQALYEHLGDRPIQVREVNLDFIELDTDIRQSKSVPVVVLNTPKVANGFVMPDSMQPAPGTVVLTGPASLLEQVSEIEVELPEMDTLDASVIRMLPVTSPSVFIQITPEEIEVVVDVEPDVEMSFDMPVETKGNVSGVQISPSRVNVTVHAPKSIGDQLDASEINAWVQLTDDLADSAQLTVMTSVPEGILETRITPEVVTVSRDTISLDNN